MDFRKATKVYQETNLSTIPVIDYVLLCLNEVLRNIEIYAESNNPEERKEALAKAQDLLFELMATVDHKTAEGERLQIYYAYLNQCLIEIRIQDTPGLLEQVALQVGELVDSWEIAKAETRKQKYTTPWI
ncbi:flagellar protein FliS [Sporosarcina sp. 179-K 3D1 HS]|uniref:flagellar export chaperone FliS n=1 Tax=Sporosarcina sp. 179-K 3D1 HS TaxID=3232169 RepID=UPI0039A38E93